MPETPTCPLLPCPFCGGEVDPQGWLCNDGTRGPECNGCGATAPSLEIWNQRPEVQALKDELALAKGAASVFEATLASQAERADDGEPVTEEWLLSVGFANTAFSDEVRRDRVAAILGLTIRFALYGEHSGDSVNLPCQTRGEVRAICKALGVSLGGE